METAMLWVTIFGIIVIPLIGWAINTLITKKIDALEEQQKLDRKLFFEKLDEDRDNVEEHLKLYVRKEMYDQALGFYERQTDEKFKSMLAIMTTQFSNVEGKIEEIKQLINDKLNGHKNNGGS